jgi:hypothetical protein
VAVASGTSAVLEFFTPQSLKLLKINIYHRFTHKSRQKYFLLPAKGLQIFKTPYG